MNKRERVYAALEGQPVDRVPLSLWRHFHKQDQTPAGLASATLAFFHQYDFDLIKLTPSGLYAIEDWGAAIVQAKDDDHPPQLKKPVIKTPEEWRNLAGLNPTDGTYGAMLEAVTLIKNQLAKDDAPVLMTIFSPMTIAYKLAGETLFEHLQEHATDVHIGLATIAETTSRFAEASLAAGADGIFFASQLSTEDMLTADECQTYVVRYDLIALEQTICQPVPLVLHLHGENPYFDTVNQYPAHAVSWHNHATPPSITEALQLTDKTLMTGLSRRILEHGSPEEVKAQTQEAIAQTGGKRLILAPACVIPPMTPVENLQAVVKVNRSLA
jgi:uroporphyrinogen decarboxylase